MQPSSSPFRGVSRLLALLSLSALSFSPLLVRAHDGHDHDEPAPCITAATVPMCGSCWDSSQCSSGICSSVMKKCIVDSSTLCSATANCTPACTANSYITCVNQCTGLQSAPVDLYKWQMRVCDAAQVTAGDMRTVSTQLLFASYSTADQQAHIDSNPTRPPAANPTTVPSTSNPNQNAETTSTVTMTTRTPTSDATNKPQTGAAPAASASSTLLAFVAAAAAAAVVVIV